MLRKAVEFVCSITGADSSSLESQNLIDLNASQIEVTRHPYGFYIWNVPWLNSAWQLRVHLWLPEKRTRQMPNWPIHAHSGRLHSFILEGAIRNNDYIFNETLEGDGAVYSVSHEGDVSVLTKTSMRGQVSRISSSIIDTDQKYFVERKSFHASEVDPSALTISIALRELHQPITSCVFGQLIGPSSLRFDRQAISSDEIAAVKRTLAAKLAV